MYGEGAWERAANPVPFVPGCRPLIYFSIWDKVRVTELYSTSTISVLTAYKHPVSLSSAYLHNNPRLCIRNITKHKNTENTKFVYTKIWVHLVLWFIMYDLLKWTTIICPKFSAALFLWKIVVKTFYSSPDIQQSVFKKSLLTYKQRNSESFILEWNCHISFICHHWPGWLPTWLGAACLSIALIGFVAYAA